MRGSDYAELKAFAAVVERSSFARAAEHLGVSPSALSQTIRQLEARLGARLLNRTTRSVAPTAAGEQLYARIAPLFRAMADAVAEASAAAGQMSGGGIHASSCWHVSGDDARRMRRSRFDATGRRAQR